MNPVIREHSIAKMAARISAHNHEKMNVKSHNNSGTNGKEVGNEFQWMS